MTSRGDDEVDIMSTEGRVDAARKLAEPVARLGGGFMSAPATFEEGRRLGLPRLDYYVGGRGGVLGPVSADAVIDAFVWFEPGMIRRHWQAALAATSPLVLAQHWAEQAYVWGRLNLPDPQTARRLQILAGRVVTHADPSVGALFRGWMELPVPSDSLGAAAHYLYAMRELRGAWHAVAVSAEEIAPADAVAIKTPRLAEMFGWSDLPDPQEARSGWVRAEEATDGFMATCLTCLSATELDELVSLAVAADSAVSW
jgi:hypothetical protein